MAEEEGGERTEEATPQRREEFRKQGQVAMTREAGTAVLFFGFAGMVWLFGRFFAEHISILVERMLGEFAVSAARGGELFPAVEFAGTQAVLLVGPVFLAAGALAFFTSVLQVGFLTNTEVISPDLNKINPINGFMKIFSMRSLVEGLKATLKVSLVVFISYLIIKSEIPVLPRMTDFTPQQTVKYLIDVMVQLFYGVGLFMAILAVLDYGYNWWDLEKRMMMTKQEVKEEVKNREGNPQIKARIRKIQRDLAQKRMMEAVPKADVIITNPTHIAIALKYDANLPAPQIIAKGADFVAEKIKELARQHNIPIVENKPLARTIFKTLKIGQVIPRELFQAVAEVLAYVYRLKKKVVQ